MDLKFLIYCQGCQGFDLNNFNLVYYLSYELIFVCNYDCIFCYLNVVVKFGKVLKLGYYGWENFYVIIVFQYGELLISLCIVEVNRMFCEKFLNVRLDFQINGFFLIEELWVKFDFDLVMISFDVVSREKYFKIINVDIFEVVVNVFRIVGLDKFVCLVVRIIFMLGINDEDILKIVEFVVFFGIDEMMFQLLIIYEFNVERLKKVGLDFERVESIREFFKVVMEVKKYIDVRISGCQFVIYRMMDLLMFFSVKRVVREVVFVVKRERFL